MPGCIFIYPLKKAGVGLNKKERGPQEVGPQKGDQDQGGLLVQEGL